jgi:hypothetical protein
MIVIRRKRSIRVIILCVLGAVPGVGVHEQALAQGVAPPSMSVSVPRTPAAFIQVVCPLLEQHGLTRAQAVLFTAHLARETGWGRYPMAGSVDSALSMIRDLPRYREAWILLQRGDLRWYSQLGREGYYEVPDSGSIDDLQREYEAAVHYVRHVRYDGR